MLLQTESIKKRNVAVSVIVVDKAAKRVAPAHEEPDCWIVVGLDGRDYGLKLVAPSPALSSLQQARGQTTIAMISMHNEVLNPASPLAVAEGHVKVAKNQAQLVGDQEALGATPVFVKSVSALGVSDLHAAGDVYTPKGYANAIQCAGLVHLPDVVGQVRAIKVLALLDVCYRCWPNVHRFPLGIESERSNETRRALARSSLNSVTGLVPLDAASARDTSASLRPPSWRPTA